MDRVQKFSNSECCTPLLESFKVYMRNLSKKICTCTALLLHHDNVPAHTSLKTTEFVTTNNVVIIPPPCDVALLLVVTIWKRSINPITNPNPTYSHSYT
jgi:hypothetical protein